MVSHCFFPWIDRHRSISKHQVRSKAISPIVQCVVGLWNESFTEISGFLYANTRSFTTALIGIILGHGVQFVIALVMTYRNVKNGIVEVDDNNNSVTRSVLIMNVTTIATILISKAACVCVLGHHNR